MLTRYDLYQYGKLAAAYIDVNGGPAPDLEERTINLLNHLVWGSYQHGDDPTNDAIVKAACGLLFQSANGDISQIADPELLRLAEIVGEGGQHDE